MGSASTVYDGSAASSVQCFVPVLPTSAKGYEMRSTQAQKLTFSKTIKTFDLQVVQQDIACRAPYGKKEIFFWK